jgi:hypothetical protein
MDFEIGFKTQNKYELLFKLINDGLITIHAPSLGKYGPLDQH